MISTICVCAVADLELWFGSCVLPKSHVLKVWFPGHYWEVVEPVGGRAQWEEVRASETFP
jgi:hypothetical protein